MKKAIVTAGVMLLVALTIVVLNQNKGTSSYDADKVLQSAEMGGDYLVRHFHQMEGYYDYLYDPVENKVASSYNLLRHEGTTYALLGLYEATKNEEYLSVAEQALKFIYIQEEACPPPHGELKCVYEAGSVKLGGNALAVLAFTEHVRVTGTTRYLKKAQTYAQWLVTTQNEQGEFATHEQTSEGYTTDLESEYYPGEAIFALMRLYALDKNETWLTSATKGAQWLINVRDQGKPIHTLPHDHWLLYALNELCRTTCDPLFIAHARKLTDAIVGSQLVDQEDPRWNGGFYTPPRSTPTATRMEGLLAAEALFRRIGDIDYAERARATLDRALPFLMSTQVRQQRAEREQLHAEGALGGFTESLDDHLIRIDYVQHAISALIGYSNQGA